MFFHLFVLWKLMSIMKCLKVYFKFYLVHFTFLQGKCCSFYGIAHKN